MERIWVKKWPAGVSLQLKYRLGEKPLHEYLRQNAMDFPEKPAFIFYGRTISWGELNQHVESFAGFLNEKGIKKGDRVALFLQNCPQYLIAHYGAQRLGAIIAPCSPMFKEWELEYEINDSGAKVIVTSDDLFPIVDKIRPQTSLEEVVVTNYRDMIPSKPDFPLPKELKCEKKFFPAVKDLMEIISAPHMEIPALSINIWQDIAMIVYTSGTTGRPKGAMLTYGSALFKNASLFHFNGFHESDVNLGLMPVFHIAGNVLSMGVGIYGGITTVLLTRFEAEAIISAFKKYKCTIWYSVTPMLQALMNYQGINRKDISSLRFTMATSFGMALTQEMTQAWQLFTGGSPVWELGYGLSETHTCDVLMPFDKVKFGSVGIPVFDTDVLIIDTKTGKELGINEVGEIVIRNPGVFKGYWQNSEATGSTLRNGWVYTGDIGRIDEDGYLYFMGRVKEMIKCSGYSVFPEDVEFLLMKHPAVERVAVIGVPDPVRGESVKAFIVPKPEYKGKVKEQEVIAWAKENMAAYKYPRMIEFRDILPATGAGKVLRRLLKEENNEAEKS